MDQKKKHLRNLFVLLLLCFIITCFMDKLVCATEQDTETEVNYTYRYVKDKIYMIPGESRLATGNTSGQTTFESSNPNIAMVNNEGLIVAKKGGTVKITQTNGTYRQVYTVKVNESVDIIIFAGQSNMVGYGGNALYAPVPSVGTAYEFDTSTNTHKCIYLREPFGNGIDRSNGFDNKTLNETKGTIASSFAINYYKQTKTPIVGVYAAQGGSSTNTWLNRGLADDTKKRVKLAKTYLKKSGVKIRHIYMVWYQGETDAVQGLTADQYCTRMKSLYKKMKTVGVERIMLITIGQDKYATSRNNTIIGALKKLPTKSKNFVLVSKIAPSFVNNSSAYYSDSIHINQFGLNKIGYEAGKAAGKYAKKAKK